MIGYKRIGVSEAGAPMYKGRWNKPPVWLALVWLFCASMFVLTIPSVIVKWNRPHRHHAPLFSPEADQFFRRAGDVIMYPMWVFTFGGSGVWMLRTRYRLRHLKSSEAMCRQFQMDFSDLQEWAAQKQITPTININGQDYYNPRDFGDINTLLRPSAMPVLTRDMLLRPSVGTEEAKPEQLLRAAQE